MVIELYLKEIKYRFIYTLLGVLFCFVVVYSYSMECFYIISEPYCKLWGSGFFLIINMFEVLLGYLKISFMLSILYFLLLGVFNIWLFMAPALYEEYSNLLLKYVLGFIFSVISLFFLIEGVILKYIYLYSIKISDIVLVGEYGLDLEPRMLNYIDLNFKLVLLFYGIAYIPFIIGIISSWWLEESINIVKYRLWFYIFLYIIIISAFPPDFILHILILGIIVTLCELIILFIIFLNEYIIILN